MSGVRIDKWLWAARFFRTRALASRACDLGRIQSNGNAAKASREVRLGDMLRVKTEGASFEVEVLALSEIRGPAAVAQTLYSETEASREMRVKLEEERKGCGAIRTPGRGPALETRSPRGRADARQSLTA